MSSQTIKFEDKEVDEKEFNPSKQAILFNDVDTDKIVVSSVWNNNEITSKFFIGYLSKNVIRPLCVILPQMSGFIKYFEDGNKNMSFKTDDESVYSNYSSIWNKVKKLLKLKFSTNPTYDEKYILNKVNMFNGVNNTTFIDDKIPKEKNHYACIAPIDIDSVLKVDKKKCIRKFI